MPSRSRKANRSSGVAAMGGGDKGGRADSDYRMANTGSKNGLRQASFPIRCSPFALSAVVAILPAFWRSLPPDGRSGRLPYGCGCSSGVEHDLAKVGVEGSNPFARSIFHFQPEA